MATLISLDQVNASILPANVMVLLSKYAQATHRYTGMVVELSSMSVFEQVHKTNRLTSNLEVRRLHRNLLVEVNRHLLKGTMHTNLQRNESLRQEKVIASPERLDSHAYRPTVH